MNTNPGIYGRKLGSTQYFTDDGTVVRVSVIEAGPVTVIGKRTKEKDGYSALIVGLGERAERHTSKPRAGIFKKANVTPKQTVREAPGRRGLRREVRGRTDDEARRDLQARPVRRRAGQDPRPRLHRRHAPLELRGGRRSHGTHEYFRHGGSIGTNMTPGRTLPNLRMSGQYGNETVSVQNLKLARVDADKHLLLIEGGVPGAKNGLVLVRHAVKKFEGGRKRKG